jgi:hypothetical protein
MGTLGACPRCGGRLAVDGEARDRECACVACGGRYRLDGRLRPVSTPPVWQGRKPWQR